ncbi:MAG: isoprenylcysteine carboxylmethyltransferase family protein [Chitinophagaceae bacterium]
MNDQHIILFLVWLMYCILHSVLASGKVKRWADKKLGASAKFYRFGYTVFAFAGLVGILIYQVSITSPLLFSNEFAIQLGGSLLAAIGAALIMLNILKYFMQLSGVKWLVSETVTAKLERGGLHRYVRHPLYLSTFLFIWSLWIVYPYLSLLIANTVITLYTLIALRFEEQKLIAEFGTEYENYRKSVPMIIPSLKSFFK